MVDLVSVIIPTIDKEITLVDRCVKSLIKSTYTNIEIVVVNENKERSEQRNLGIGRAMGTFIMYLDSDQYISPRLVEECVGLMKSGYDAIYIPEIITTPGWFGWLRNWERSFYNGTPIDCVRFFRKKDCPKFDVKLLGPEDSDFDRQVKGRRVISNNVLFHNDNVNMIQWFKKKTYYAKGMDNFIAKYPNDKILNWRWRCFGVFMENGKWKKFLSNPFMAIAVLGIILIRGVIYYGRKKLL